MHKLTTGKEIPVGLGLALEEYKAMDYFFSLSAEAQQQIINHSHTLESTHEMLDYVHSLISSKINLKEQIK